jgi:hypothetical protein
VKGVMAMAEHNDRSTVVEEPSSSPGTSQDRHRTGQADNTAEKVLPDTERVTVNLTPRSVRALRNVVGWTHYSKTDVINRALQVYEFVQQIVETGGSVHIRQTRDGELERLTIF